MPCYEYLCPSGHRYEELRPVDERDDERECSAKLQCYAIGERQISLPSTFIGSEDRPARGQG